MLRGDVRDGAAVLERRPQFADVDADRRRGGLRDARADALEALLPATAQKAPKPETLAAGDLVFDLGRLVLGELPFRYEIVDGRAGRVLAGGLELIDRNAQVRGELAQEVIFRFGLRTNSRCLAWRLRRCDADRTEGPGRDQHHHAAHRQE